MTYLLDTHVWIWMLESPEKLSQTVRQLLLSTDPRPRLLLSAISLVELTILVQKGRLNLLPEINSWIQTALDDEVRVISLGEDIGRDTTTFSDFNHFDPADRVIAATARMENAILITADKTLRRYKKVQTIW